MRLIIVLGVLLVALTGWIVWNNPERIDLDSAARADVDMQFIGLSQGTTGYTLGGDDDAPWVVLIHGYSVPSAQWADTAKALQDAGYRTLHYDLYGRGWSDRPGGDYDLDRYAQQLTELLDVLGAPEQVRLVGLSMGGLIAAHYAVTRPEKVAELALIAPFNAVPDIPDILTWPLIGKVVAHALYFPRQIEMQKDAFADPAMAEQYLPLFTEQLPYRGFRRAIYSTLQTVILKDPLPTYLELGTQGRDIHLIWGSEDRVVPIDQATRLLRALRPDANLVTIDGAGHAPHLEAPEATQAALIDALGAAQPEPVAPEDVPS
ncbi:alpha/beta fold hydrolase [Polycyclovorans algicola]|uniref:alpha/beta fold hydrolase n=1 Tax=Polycyclovorans algicola TaxID=616992 RepID=UPI0004A73AF4|nr:alpha/beta hydrolase [Polycyclovorans algicola]